MADPRLLAAMRFGLKPSEGGGGKCATCEEGGDGRMLHRVKHQGMSRHLCSSCVLFYHRGLYCSVCYQIFRNATELADPALWITCCKCLQLSHVNCARKKTPLLDHSSFVCFDCGDRSFAGEAPGSPQTENVAEPCSKKMRTINQLKESCIGLGHAPSPFDQKILAAAKVVASLAAKEAADAKAKACLKAGLAAIATARAKSALDVAYRIGRDESKIMAQVARLPVTNTVAKDVLEERKHENALLREVLEARKHEKAVAREVPEGPEARNYIHAVTRKPLEARKQENAVTGEALEARKHENAVAREALEARKHGNTVARETSETLKRESIVAGQVSGSRKHDNGCAGEVLEAGKHENTVAGVIMEAIKHVNSAAGEISEARRHV